MKKLVLIFVMMFSFAEMNMAVAQSREFIRKKIEEKGQCKNVAITKTNGDLMIYGKNGWASNHCPKSLDNALRQLNNEKKSIDDVQLTEDGKWLILFGGNGYISNDIPRSLEKKLDEYNDNEEIITSVTFNDAGQWIVITNKHYSASEKWIQDWLKESAQQYGALWAACMTDEAMVAVYKGGFASYGNVPADLTKTLEKTEINVYRIKIAGNAWFIADKDGHCDFNM